MSGYLTTLLVIMLIALVIYMNVSMFSDKRWKEEGLVFIFTNRKLYILFAMLAAIGFTVFAINV